jgi:hypothetical protein
MMTNSGEAGPLPGRLPGRRTEGALRKPAERHRKPKQGDEAVTTLLDILDDCRDWRDRLPNGLADSATADRLHEGLALGDLVEQLQGVELPKGFGRDWITGNGLPENQVPEAGPSALCQARQE